MVLHVCKCLHIKSNKLLSYKGSIQAFDDKNSGKYFSQIFSLLSFVIQGSKYEVTTTKTSTRHRRPERSEMNDFVNISWTLGGVNSAGSLLYLYLRCEVWGVRCECYISPYKICIRCRPCQIWLDTPWNWSRNFMIQRITFRNVLKSQIQKNLLWLADYLDTMCRRSDLSSWTTIDGQDLICSNSLQAVKCNYIEPFTLTLILSLAFTFKLALTLTLTHTLTHFLKLTLTHTLTFSWHSLTLSHTLPHTLSHSPHTHSHSHSHTVWPGSSCSKTLNVMISQLKTWSAGGTARVK